MLLLLAALGTTIYLFISSIEAQVPVAAIFCALAFIAELVMLGGLVIVNPNEAQVLQLFGT